jgi:hypothetical protein
MMQRIRKSGPKNVVRPFNPTLDMTGEMKTDEKIAEALEHIAVAMSALDHNLELIAEKMDGLLRIQAMSRK